MNLLKVLVITIKSLIMFSCCTWYKISLFHSPTHFQEANSLNAIVSEVLEVCFDFLLLCLKWRVYGSILDGNFKTIFLFLPTTDFVRTLPFGKIYFDLIFYVHVCEKMRLSYHTSWKLRLWLSVWVLGSIFQKKAVQGGGAGYIVPGYRKIPSKVNFSVQGFDLMLVQG